MIKANEKLALRQSEFDYMSETIFAMSDLWSCSSYKWMQMFVGEVLGGIISLL